MAAVTWIGSNIGAGFGTVTMPTHAVGDVIIIVAAGSGVTKPTAGGSVPSWNTGYYDASGNYLFWTVATSTSHTSGMFTGTIYLLTASTYRNADTTDPIGGVATTYTSSSTSSLQAPAITQENTSGDTQIHHNFSAGSTSTRTWNSAPSGYTARATTSVSAYSYGGRVLTKDSTTSDGAVTNTLSGKVSGGWMYSVEILPAPATATGAFFSMWD